MSQVSKWPTAGLTVMLRWCGAARSQPSMARQLQLVSACPSSLSTPRRSNHHCGGSLKRPTRTVYLTMRTFTDAVSSCLFIGEGVADS